jgi:iron-sulfur cluster assembly accessory protein
MENTMDTSVAEVSNSAPVATDAQVMILTPRAVQQVKEVASQQNLVDHFLVVRVVPAGCSGLGYDLNLVKETKDGDLIWEQDGVKMATDQLSVAYLKGTVVDYHQSETQAGFKFENPNAKSSCGCGSSFSA